MSQLAYLVIREGSKWTDVFRLVPGQAVTIGRAPTNQIVIKDERCSRFHAEIFMTRGEWTLRDLALPDPQAELVVRVSADFVERYRFVSIVPEPRDEALDGADVVFRFDANRATRGIVFNVEPQHAGWNRGEFRVAAGPAVSVEQLVYP